ncbi:DUF4123 domain-containing protein [Pseudomonas sp. S1Bt30]|uniref:DUF4123 domain-containing protein n=1 Tax=Pseudomonas quebecensis TaxID=2995174 RepID=A0ABY6QE89_9PSED|nr:MULTISPECIES: DUF4123 domain-containing protein [Pseudomonas]MCX4063204.1 DUF4123 domain-containing protein [Pseudomonas quebecensis]UZW18109.1 DUF4123 domain-containing protein [Pseudomonas quebecensis]UZW24478.1 DUF4123 domain-containing protein [Pseudomonas quebecensis]UZW29540.1 DUF4123 domain-containing protein [Pseudomonas quebecensis]
MEQPLSPGAWLAQWPLQPHEQLFAVLGGASDAKPFDAWQGMAAGASPRAIWAGTAYADWTQVMPYLARVEPGSAFLDWVTHTQAEDWGWLAVSSSPLEVVLAHLQGLTQVNLPEGQAVFLRFWDGTQVLPLLQHLGSGAGQVLPVFQRYLINGQPLAVATGPVGAAKTSPWWQVPATLLEHLAEQSPQTRIDNLLQWLEEQRPDLCAAFTPPTLQHKVAYFARGPVVTYAALTDYLDSEAS